MRHESTWREEKEVMSLLCERAATSRRRREGVFQRDVTTGGGEE